MLLQVLVPYIAQYNLVYPCPWAWKLRQKSEI